jgi:hypothetical protein
MKTCTQTIEKIIALLRFLVLKLKLFLLHSPLSTALPRGGLAGWLSAF